ncbi:MAG: T9SS type A sorting domain-containing protein [Flavobacteriales bacterium]|nr:T9SS type A sorting domain-containing protein [Flavobacteriales bacterium]
MAEVKYYSQGAYPRAYFQKNSLFSLVLQQPESVLPNAPVYSHRLDVRPYAAQSVTPVGQSVKTHYQNFFLPGCGTNGITEVNGYDYLKYPSVYDYIDMVFYSGSAGQKMAFYCWPGSDPNKIALQFFGQDSLKIDVAGYLKVFKSGYWVKLDEAVAYQVNGNGDVLQLGWSANYVNTNGDNVVELAFDNYDPTLPLVLQIGPTPAQPQSPTDGICWGSYYGGSSDDEVFDTETDADGNHYLTGYTESDFLTFQNNVGTILVDPSYSVILTSFGPSEELKWTVYYGGSGDQSAFAMAVRGQPAEIYIGGYTTANNLYPQVLAGAYNDQNGAGTVNSRGFIGKFNSLGQVLWSTYFGSANEEIHGMDFDAQGRLHIVGECDGSYPAQTLSGATSWSPGGVVDVMIARFSSTDALQWCTAYGGAAIDQGTDIACHNNGFYVSGYTASTNVPIIDGGSSAYDQTTNAGGTDNVLLSFTSSASCNWATYFGGNGTDQPGFNSLDTKPNGDFFLAGRSTSSNLPTLGAGGFLNSTGSANGSGYISGFRGTSRARVWCTYVGGVENTGIESLELANDKLFAVGYTSEPNIPIVPANGLYDQSTLIGLANGIGANNGKDGLILGFEASTALAYSSFYGGEQGGLGESIRSASFAQGELFIAGITSKNFPIDQSFPLFDPGDPAYYDDVYDVTFTNWQDMFVAVLCTESFTGPVGIAESGVGSPSFAAMPMGDDTWQLSGLPNGNQVIRVHDAAGRLILSEQATIAPATPHVLDVAHLANGIYTVSASNGTHRTSVKVAISR